MASAQTTSTRFSNVQIELLKLYPYNVSEKEIKDIRKMLADYFAEKIDADLDKLWEKNDWNDQTIESWKSEHMHSKTSFA